ncbi:MAG: hypothetical protein JWN31_31 [Frankiales bacterium]|nr:hypothetical protein [Frankiales bacterium]
MDIAPDLVIDLTDRALAAEPRPLPGDPRAIPRWGTEGRYTPKYCPPPKLREKRGAVPGLTILPEALPEKRSRLDVRALLRHS